MSKKQLIAAITLAAFLGLPVGAQAAVAATPTTAQVSAKVIFSEDEDGYEDEDHEEYEDEDHEDGYEDEDEDEYAGGFEDVDDEGTFVMPPVVVDPNKAGVKPGRHLGSVGEGAHIPDDKAFSGTVDAPATAPIQVQKVLPSRKTPTDVFVDTAVVGLGAVALGAVTLGGMVGVRAIRARRSGENTDYFYGE